MLIARQRDASGEMESNGFCLPLHPFKWQLTEWILWIATPDVGMRADKPALLYILQRGHLRSRWLLAVRSVRLVKGPKGRFVRPAVLVDGERLKSVLVDITEIRIVEVELVATDQWHAGPRNPQSPYRVPDAHHLDWDPPGILQESLLFVR